MEGVQAFYKLNNGFMMKGSLVTEYMSQIRR
jgi:hypothetical protein